MEKTECSECQKRSVGFFCVGCQTPAISKNVCKNCANFVGREDFAFLPDIPVGLVEGAYCSHCYRDMVQPELDRYTDLMERAKRMTVFEKDQGKETRFYSRLEKPIVIENCADRHEALLRLAFLAARMDFNAIIDVAITSEKVKTGGSYQKLKWRGHGVPVQLDLSKLR